MLVKSLKTFRKLNITLFILTIVVIVGIAGYNFSGKTQEVSNYSSSWVGNSFGGGYTNQYWVQNLIEDIVVSNDGKVITASTGNEGKKIYGIYKDGQVWDNKNLAWNFTGVGALGNNSANVPKGNTVALHPNQNYIYAPIGQEPNKIGMWSLTKGKKTDFIADIGFEAYGLAANESFLVASGNNLIKVFDISTGKLIRSWNVPFAKEMTFERDGDIWVISTTQIKEYSIEGSLKRTISDSPTWKPVDLSIDNLGRLVVTDDGPAHIIRFFDITDSPKQVDILGVKGGIKLDPTGKVEPGKFWGLTGCDIDEQGNIYVATSEQGAMLSSFTPDKQLRWQLFGLNFIDVVSVDPKSDGLDIYGVQEHYVMDYSKPNGEQWTFKGYSLDSDTYPQDHRRFSQDISTPWIAYVNKRKFMYLTDMVGKFLLVYRFNGETAIPSGAFFPKSENWATGSPPNSSIWRDNNGDGQLAADEYITGTKDAKIDGWKWWVSEDGTIWNMVNTTINRYSSEGLDSKGNPIYTFSNKVSYDAPTNPGWTKVQRVNYDIASDTMYVSGYTSKYPENAAKYGSSRSMGPVVASYSNWNSNNPTLNWSMVLDHYYTNDWETQLQPRSFAVAGNYMFVTYESFGPAGNEPTQSRGEVDIYNLQDGSKVGYMLPTPEIGGPPPTANNSRPTIVGAVDIVQGIQAFKRSTGEYLVFVEDDKWAKVFFYRWKPVAKYAD